MNGYKFLSAVKSFLRHKAARTDRVSEVFDVEKLEHPVESLSSI